MKSKAFLFIIAAGILWGTSGIFVHYLSPYGFDALQMTAVRGGASFLILALITFLFKRELFRVSGKQLLLVAGVGATLFGTASCYFFAMQITSVSTAVVLMYTAPLYVMLFSVLVWHERLSPLKGLSVVTMLLGCCLVSGLVGGFRFDALGIGIGVLSGISYAAYNIFTKMAVRAGCKTGSVTLYSFLVMALLALLFSRPWEIVTYTAKAPATVVPLLLGLAVVTLIFPYYLYTASLADLPADTASALAIVEPMAATVFSVILFDERLDAFGVAGIVLVLFSVLLLSRAERE